MYKFPVADETDELRHLELDPTQLSVFDVDNRELFD
jgi:hypothetical protein